VGERTDVAAKDLEQFRVDGYVILEQFLDPDEIGGALAEVFGYMPSWEEYARAPGRYPGLSDGGAAPGSARAQFPFEGPALNNVFAHRRILDVVEGATGTDRISLEHAGVTGKYAGLGDHEQQLHVDYGNHTLVYPQNPAKNPRWYDFGCLVYFTEVTIDLGPTYIVSQKVTGEDVGEPRHRSRDEYAWMYEHEVPATVPAGSAVLYDIRTFHRGSAIRAAEGARFSQHLGYRVAPDPYFDPRHYMNHGGTPRMNAFLVLATPEQRSMVGFPPPGDTYWDAETLGAVQRRYPQMDMTPYE
jgi:hypothetical protein